MAFQDNSLTWFGIVFRGAVKLGRKNGGVKLNIMWA